MHTDTKKRGRIFRWGVRVVAVLVILFVVASIVLYFLARSATSRWEHLASELRAKDQPLTYAEIDATRPTIADDSNGAVAIRQAGLVLGTISEPNNSGVFFLDHECKADFFEGIERRCLAATREYVEARRQALVDLSELVRFPDVRLNLSYEGTWFDTYRHRGLGKLVNLDAVLKTIDGDVPAAVDAIVLQLRMSEPLYAEPELILQLVAISTDWMAVNALEGLLRTHEIEDGELERLQFEWKRHVQHQTLKPSLLGQRASFIRMTDKEKVMADAQAAFAAVGGVLPKKRWKLPNPIDWIPFQDDWFIYENRVQGVTILTRLLDASDDLSELLDVARREQASLTRFAPGRTLIRIMLPSLTRGIELHARAAARFRCVPVVIAAERYRIANGRFPNSSDELVSEYLAEWPRDPYDGKPMRFARTDSGIVVYSVGENTVDDGGQVVPAEGERQGRDFGVRLIEPGERGLRLIR